MQHVELEYWNRESISHQELLFDTIRMEILMRVGRWLVRLFAAGKLKRINNRNNDDDRRKKAKYVVLSVDYLGTSYFVSVCIRRCSVLLRCVLYYLLFHLYWVLSLACLLAVYSMATHIFPCCTLRNTRIHTTQAGKDVHTLGEYTTTSIATTKRTYQVSKHTHSHTHMHTLWKGIIPTTTTISSVTA